MAAPGKQAGRKAGGRLAPAADLLAEVWRMGQTLPALPESCRPKTLAEAYKLQALLETELGFARAGWKIGCTSAAARAILKADGPFAGRVFLARCHATGAKIAAGQYRMRGLEAEFAFVLGRDLRPRKKPYTRAEVLAAVDDLHPAIEIVDSRYTDWLKVTLPELVADMAANGALVVGAPAKNWRRKDLAKIAVTMEAGGKIVGRGKGADVMGHPLEALAWLANNPPVPEGLKAGEVVSTGTAAGFYRAGPKDKAVARFAGIGKVEASFV
jgi:2-oxo-3-hexenedioate decarboxylase/2-keto-4-pentenoate hydratase